MKKIFVLLGEIESFLSTIMLMNSALEKVMYNLGLLILYLEGIEVMLIMCRWTDCLTRQYGSAVSVSKRALSPHYKKSL